MDSTPRGRPVVWLGLGAAFGLVLVGLIGLGLGGAPVRAASENLLYAWVQFEPGGAASARAILTDGACPDLAVDGRRLPMTARGRVRLRSTDPAAPPIVDSGFFTHPHDLPRLIEAIGIVRRLAGVALLADLWVAELEPGPTVTDPEALGRAVWANLLSYHHGVGTCRMGTADDSAAVVDARGRVHGVAGLAVIDASIMPVIPAANTNLPTFLVAERCAAWLIGAAG